MIRDHLKQAVVVAAAYILLSVFFVHWAASFVRAERALFAWDTFHYWNVAADLSLRMRESTWSSIAAFGRSMHHDYNDTCTLPASCSMAIFGTSRLCYVVSNAIFLIIPSALVCLWLWVRGGPVSWSQSAFMVLAFLALLAVPLTWNITVGGFSDVGGLIMAAIATDLLSRTDVRSKDTVRWLAIGGAMGCLALCKRWFLYYVVALIAMMLVEVVYYLIQDIRRTHPFSVNGLFRAAYGPFLCGCSLVAVDMLTFPLPLQIASTNYSEAYAAYQSEESWPSAVAFNLYLIVRMFGIAQVALSCACFVVALFFISTRRRAIYLFIPGILALMYFSRVQTMGDHHMLLLYIAIAVTPLFLARQLCTPLFPHSGAWGWTIVLLAGLISCLNFQSMFLPSPPFGSSNDQACLFSQPPLRPEQRSDMAEIENLLRFLSDKFANSGQPPKQKVYLLSSSVLFNSSLLQTAAFQMGKALSGGDYLYGTRDADSRDGFPDELVSAEMVLVADPMQTHLHAEQKILSVPTRQFLSAEGFARAFIRDAQSFQLDQGVRVYVFERTRASTPEEVAQLHKEIGLPAAGKQP